MPNERNPARAPDRAQAEIDHLDALLDEGLRATFPASDPVAISFRKKPQSDGRSPATPTPSASPKSNSPPS